MPESRYFDLKALFVSVDPDRDTSEKIEKFIIFKSDILNYFLGIILLDLLPIATTHKI